MKIVFVSNFLNPHQFPISSEFYRLTQGNFYFVETEKMPNSFSRAGYPEYNDIPWLIQLWQAPDRLQEVVNLINNADTVIEGGIGTLDRFIEERVLQGKLTFKYSERWLKRGLLNLLSPRIAPYVLKYLLYYRNRPYYLLCASAFAASDAYKVGNFRNKAFRWGYFPKVDRTICENDILSSFDSYSPFRIMTVCRMLSWKRPIMMIKAARFLRTKGIPFEMNMFGTGPLENKIEQLIKLYSLENHVYLRGNIPNEEIHTQMRQHHCLLFTSNKREGWGAVVNEAMANGCVVIGSSKIGSIPYLIKDGENGLIFKDGDQNELNVKLFSLASDQAHAKRLAKNARTSIETIWSPEEAASRLISLANSLMENRDSPFIDGPCSKAPIYS